jgi:cellulose synthase/poly-beta-1,6-N-acetylglucosamine synthase-like glycosyltransferase
MGKQCQNGKLSFHQTINRLTKLKAFEYQSITSSVIGVLMNQGATELTLILSLANSHARFLVS